MKLFDQYVLRNFGQAYLYCVVSFISIWLIFDLSDHLSNMIEQRPPLGEIAQYYLLQMPYVLVLILPVSLMLALLFSLSRMSRANEIVSMLTAGVSVTRLLVPLLCAGILTTGLSMAMNYALAPNAETARKEFTDLPTRKQRHGLRAQIFRNRGQNRTWFIEHLYPGANELSSVQILQQDEENNIDRTYFATRAFYRPKTRQWELQHAKVVDYDEAGSILREQMHSSLVISDWTETPFRLASAQLQADLLSVPELRAYLRHNADFPAPLLAPFRTQLHYRFALPFDCFVVALIAGPLGIGFSRRGVFSSIGAAVLLIFALNFSNHFFVALGEGARVPPWLAAWAPTVFFGLVGIYLLRLRHLNRESPRFLLARASL